MIQIDMPMPEKCEDCIFCGDSCNCVASEYDGIGINVGCAFRTGRRDIRCPLKEQEEKEFQSDSYYISTDQKFHLTCPFCGHSWWEEKPFPPFCQKCGKDITNQATIGWKEMVHPDEEAMDKRDAFLSDENGERLNKAFQSLWGDD